jgi:hypothetical protein
MRFRISPFVGILFAALTPGAAATDPIPGRVTSSGAGTLNLDADGPGMNMPEHQGHAPHAPADASPAPPPHAGMHGDHGLAAMKGLYGPYAMAREGSGTSWQPDSTPMEGLHSMKGEWTLMADGFADAVYDHQGGPRGDSKVFVPTMLMLMAQRRAGPGTLGARTMWAADPGTVGKTGYPLLLQTGEAANGEPLLDRQHPHDLFMELAASYSLRWSDAGSIFVYAGLPGEPALGPSTFMHRFSGRDIPEAPITHHWFDSTHITFGVVTLGVVWRNVKLEGSAFRGREPDEERWNIETPRLDSYSTRVSWNPTRDWALQGSWGRLKQPEELEPGVDVDRTTASVTYSRGSESAISQTTVAWGRNKKRPGDALDAFMAESTLAILKVHTVFARLERVKKDELFEGGALAHQAFWVSKATVGAVHDFNREGHLAFGLGALGSLHFVPDVLTPFYGDRPVSFMVFARMRVR